MFNILLILPILPWLCIICLLILKLVVKIIWSSINFLMLCVMWLRVWPTVCNDQIHEVPCLQPVSQSWAGIQSQSADYVANRLRHRMLRRCPEPGVVANRPCQELAHVAQGSVWTAVKTVHRGSKCSVQFAPYFMGLLPNRGFWTRLSPICPLKSKINHLFFSKKTLFNNKMPYCALCKWKLLMIIAVLG